MEKALRFVEEAAREQALQDKQGYLASHEHIVRFFGEVVRPILIDSDPNGAREAWNRTAFLGASITYSWMPTILRGNHSTALARAHANLRSVSTCADAPEFFDLLNSLGDSELLDLLAWVNGSIVGTSKFLHFLNPGAVPIWDARVAANFGIFEKANIERVDSYKQYASLVGRKTMSDPGPYGAYLKFLGPGSKLDARSIEFALFIYGEGLLLLEKKRKSERKKALHIM